MIRSVVALALLLPLCGCDKSEFASKALAQCKLLSEQAKATDPNYYERGYMHHCMQSKGFVEDDQLTEEDGSSCLKDDQLHEQATCYRPDKGFAKWIAHNL